MIFLMLIVLVVGVFIGFMLCGFVFDKQITEELAKRRGVGKPPTDLPKIEPRPAEFTWTNPPRKNIITTDQEQKLLNQMSSEHRRELEIGRLHKQLPPLDNLNGMSSEDIKAVLTARQIFLGK